MKWWGWVAIFLCGTVLSVLGRSTEPILAELFFGFLALVIWMLWWSAWQ